METRINSLSEKAILSIKQNERSIFLTLCKENILFTPVTILLSSLLLSTHAHAIYVSDPLGENFTIRNLKSPACLTATSPSTASTPGEIKSSQCLSTTFGESSQVWTAISGQNGTYRVISTSHSNECLDLNNNNYPILQPCNTTKKNQEWFLYRDSTRFNGRFQFIIQPVNSSSPLCLSDHYGNSTTLSLQACSIDNSQQFNLAFKPHLSNNQQPGKIATNKMLMTAHEGISSAQCNPMSDKNPLLPIRMNVAPVDAPTGIPINMPQSPQVKAPKNTQPNIPSTQQPDPQQNVQPNSQPTEQVNSTIVPASSGTPSSGTPSSGTPSSGTPSSGTPSSGTPSSGTPSSSSQCKRGVAFPKPTSNDLKALKHVSWWYNWAPAPAIAASSPTMIFIPMIWGSADLNRSSVIPDGGGTLLGFNEPNFFVQANLSAESAASNWQALQTIAKAKGLKTASPALNYCSQKDSGGCSDEDPQVYLDKFFAACSGCQVDYIALHWYNCDVDSLKNYINKFKSYNKPIWLTEFACLMGDRSPANQKRYMLEAIPYLESEPAIVKYSWFAGRSPELPTSDLLAGDGQLTELGQAYVDAPSSQPCP